MNGGELALVGVDSNGMCCGIIPDDRTRLGGNPPVLRGRDPRGRPDLRPHLYHGPSYCDLTYDWVLEFDIRGLFDNIDHTLLMRAARKHVTCDWALLYIQRWLTAPMQLEDGTLVQRTRGTPQGGIISPVLANLFLHYGFDVWMTREYPHLPWCRYADDGLIHCQTETEALALKAALQARLAECRLEMHPDKTKFAYCKDSNRKGDYANKKYDFLGYTFCPTMAINPKQNIVFVAFLPRVSTAALKSMRQAVHDLGVRRWINAQLMAWIMRKYKRYTRRKIKASRLLTLIASRNRRLFVHWHRTAVGAYAFA